VSIASPDRFTGILNVNKPKGWTSHDVVARVRRLAGQKRVGHAGTLDPMAEGVLPVLLGRATRLADFIQHGRKTYLATVQLGAATDTDDAEGTVVSTSSVPQLGQAVLDEALTRFRGEILQIPPRYSALKVAGRRAYAVARVGGEVDLAARPVTIYDLRLLGWSETELRLEITCARGTYIRALARDLAIALGTVGHLTALVRACVGPFDLHAALTPDELATRGIDTALLPPSQALPDSPTYAANADETARLANGQAVPVAGLRAEAVWVYDPTGLLVCLASADGTLLRPRLAL
jgi:tRNA pseudouridine55 synthase